LVGYACECGAKLGEGGRCPDCGRDHPDLSALTDRRA
jgi:hypothetical protein